MPADYWKSWPFPPLNPVIHLYFPGITSRSRHSTHIILLKNRTTESRQTGTILETAMKY
jgi:hypothetical protein